MPTGGVCTFPDKVVEAHPDLANTCTKSSQCPGAGHRAEDGTCRDGCDTDADCLGGQKCTLSGACAEKTEVNADGNLITPDTGAGGAPGAGGGPGGVVIGGGGAGDVIVNECPPADGAPEEHPSYETIMDPQIWRGYHHVSGYLNVEASLTLAPCAVVEFDTNAYVVVQNNGSLKALGTDTNPVVFTSDKTVPKAGDWAGISIQQDASNDSAFKNVIVEYGGNGYIYGENALQIEGSAWPPSRT